MNAHKLLLSIVIILGILIILTIGALIYGFAKKGETSMTSLQQPLERSNKEVTRLPSNIDINLTKNEKLLHLTTYNNKMILQIGDEKTTKIIVFSLQNAQKIAVFNLNY